MRVALLVSASLLMMIVGPVASLPTTGNIEGETGLAAVEGCAIDGELMAATSEFMFFPAEGCTALYVLQSPGGIAVHTARVRVGGQAEVCGLLILGGSMAGTSERFCLPAGGWHDVAVASTGSAGAFTVTWLPDPFTTPHWVNLDLDRMTVVTVA